MGGATPLATAASAQQVTEVPALLKRAVGAPAHRPFDCADAKRGVGRRVSGLSEFGRTRVGLPAALDPTNPNAYHYLALALTNIKRWDEALQVRNAPQRCARPECANGTGESQCVPTAAQAATVSAAAAQ